MDALLNAALPLAQQQPAKHGGFFPYGMAMTRDGQVTMVAGYTASEQPPSTEVLQVLYEGLRAQAEENRGAAVVSDIRLSGRGTDAIQVEVEHREGIALKVFLPYRVKRRGQLEAGQMSGEAGERRIWLH